MGDDRETLTTKARIAEQAERYEDMARVSIIAVSKTFGPYITVDPEES